MDHLRFLCLWALFVGALHAEPGQSQLSVWANEAIVATYTFDSQDYLAQQKKIAHYSGAKGVRGLAIESFQSKTEKPVCRCDR